MSLYRPLAATTITMVLLGGMACAQRPAESPVDYPIAEGSGLESHAAAFDDVIPPGSVVEVLAEGAVWAEGPLWLEASKQVLFTDPESNRIHAWSPSNGLSTWLEPSGYWGDDPRVTNSGANGLLLDAEGRLVMCQHGERRVVRLDAGLSSPPAGTPPPMTVLAEAYEGRRLNSPNDAAYASDGSLWFTDPPYGLPNGYTPDEKELPFSGVYRLTPDGDLQLVTDSLTYPNGVAFSPDGRTAYVANSDPRAARWTAIEVNPDGTPGAGRVFHDATARVSVANPGLPDGLKVDSKGNVLATGPGGVLVFSPSGEHLGTIRTGAAAANIAIGENGRTLFITATSRLLRVRL